jgi:2-polyprenyl-3-methyl-5-hydroxy-6-metoxy-1,4-benzoquinol methylase
MNCQICKDGQGISQWSFEIIDRVGLADYLRSVLKINKVELKVSQCDKCFTLFQSPAFEPEIYWGWYRTRAYQFERGIGYAPAPHESIRYAKAMADATANLLGRPLGRVLDVGCGRGFYLAMCEDRGWDVQGCEISPVYIEHANRTLGLPVWQNPYEECEETVASFDLITFWDIFEHFSDPGMILEKTKNLLRDDGIIAMEVPHARGLYARLLGKKWWFGFEHVYYYSIQGLTRLLRDHGFEPIAIVTDNINLISKEGLNRLRLFGDDGVWGRHKEDITLLRYNERSHGRKRTRPWLNPSYRFYDLCAFMKLINAPLNFLFNGARLGDQLRIFALKRAIT